MTWGRLTPAMQPRTVPSFVAILRSTGVRSVAAKRVVCGFFSQVRRRACRGRIFRKEKFGSDLLSHTVTRAVPSALKDFTSVFGMETGVAPSL